MLVSIVIAAVAAVAVGAGALAVHGPVLVVVGVPPACNLRRCGAVTYGVGAGGRPEPGSLTETPVEPIPVGEPALEEQEGLKMAAVAVYVVRHGDAEPRDSWSGPDADRPLTGRRREGGPGACRSVRHRAARRPPPRARSSEAGAEADPAPVEPRRALHGNPAAARGHMRAARRDGRVSRRGIRRGATPSRGSKSWPAPAACPCCAPTATSSGASSSSSRAPGCLSSDRWT